MKTKFLLYRIPVISLVFLLSVVFTSVKVAGQNPCMITVHLAGMTPHVGNYFAARLIDKYNLKEVDRIIVPVVPGAVFDAVFQNGLTGHSYYIDMYADLNKNGVYDPPPADHAWRLSVDNVMGNMAVNFSHNTNFTDVKWRYMLTLNLNGMVPHVGQHFEARVVDINRNFKETGRTIVGAIPSETFSVSLPYLESGHSYYVEFFADLNNNGRFDPAPTDHTWRLEMMNVTGDTSLTFSHNVNFTDLPWKNQLNVDMMGMDTHIGHQICFRVVNIATNVETARYYRNIDLPDIEVQLPALSPGADFHVDFFIDDNDNGRYDPPPIDHAWRLNTTNDAGNSTMDFMHNETFTDIGWKYQITLDANDMNPHLGQMVQLRIYKQQTSEEIGQVSITNLLVPHIIIEVPGSDYDQDYNIDFYADLNGNGMYDPPPVDHAWRISLTPALTDTTVEFVHNINFTDIAWNLGIVENIASQVGLQVYPVPAGDFAVISWANEKYRDSELRIYSVNGALVMNKKIMPEEKIAVSKLPVGMYEAVTVFEDGKWASVPFLKR